MASIIPSVFFPGVITSIAQQVFVTHPMATGSIVCPVCLELRAISIQVIYTMLLFTDIDLIESY